MVIEPTETQKAIMRVKNILKMMELAEDGNVDAARGLEDQCRRIPYDGYTLMVNLDSALGEWYARYLGGGDVQ